MSDYFAMFMSGLIIAVVLSILFGVVRGVFGERWEKAIVALAAIVFMVTVYSTGDGSASAAGAFSEPWPYWLGFFIGVVVGKPVRDETEQTLRKDGTPLLHALYRGCANE
jgi:hypothetical protein